jgi:hypothetical protein
LPANVEDVSVAVTKCDWTVVVIVAAEEYERMRGAKSEQEAFWYGRQETFTGERNGKKLFIR